MGTTFVAPKTRFQAFCFVFSSGSLGKHIVCYPFSYNLRFYVLRDCLCDLFILLTSGISQEKDGGYCKKSTRCSLKKKKKMQIKVLKNIRKVAMCGYSNR